MNIYRIQQAKDGLENCAHSGIETLYAFRGLLVSPGVAFKVLCRIGSHGVELPSLNVISRLFFIF